MTMMPAPVSSSLDHYFFNNVTVYNYGKTFQDGSLKMGVHGIFEIHLPLLESALSHIPDYKILPFSNAYLQGYFVVLENELHLLLTSGAYPIIEDKDLFTQSLDAQISHVVQGFAKQKSVIPFIEYDFNVFILVLDSYYSVIAYINKINGAEIHCLKVRNSFLSLRKKFQALARGDYFKPEQHLDFFAWIYHVEVSAIAKILGTDKPITLHDVATNTAFWPSLLATQKPDDLNGLQLSEICCSDIDLQLMRHTQSTLKELSFHELDRIKIFCLDVTQFNESLKMADVITANDILEHFAEDISLQAFKNLWQSTRRLLVIHVPFEEVPTAAYGHLSQFSRAKLMSWVALLDDCCDLTESMRSCTQGHSDENFIHEFLFLERVSTRSV